MTYKQLWDDDYLMSFAKKLVESGDKKSQHPNIQFWFEDEKDGELAISKHRLASKFFPELGIRNLILGKTAQGLDSAIPVFIRGNRCEEINGQILKSITFKVLRMMDDIQNDDLGDEVRTLLGYSKQIFEPTGLRTIPDLYDKEVFTDTRFSAFRFFQNGWIEITKDGVKPLRSYDDLPENKIIWNTSVIPRDYVSPSTIHSTSYYRDFVENLARDDDGDVSPTNLHNIKVGLGYLCHRHHFAHARKWVCVVDRHFDVARQKANGGNGKSILLGSLKNVMNLEPLDGKEFKKGRSDTFAFANVTPATEIAFFDDADETFDTKRLFSRTTGDFHIRRMRQNPFSIEASKAPKIAISSNYPLGDNDFSTQRRQYLIEVSSFYKDAAETYGDTPFDIHDNKEIAVEGGGWNDGDWNEFYRYIWECIALYLDKGLPRQAEESENFKRSRLLFSMAEVEEREELLDYFIEKLNAYAKSGAEEFAEVFYKSTRDRFPNLPKDITNRKLYEWLKEVGAAYKMNPNRFDGKNGQLRAVKLNEPKRKKRWIDAGMEDYLDVNGKNPLTDKESRVSVFKVQSLKNVSSILTKPNFNKSGDGGDVSSKSVGTTTSIK